MAIKTKNKKIIIKAKKSKSESEIIHEKGDKLNTLSLVDKWEGIIREKIKKILTNTIVRRIWGEGEFKGSFGAKAEI